MSHLQHSCNQVLKDEYLIPYLYREFAVIDTGFFFCAAYQTVFFVSVYHHIQSGSTSRL